MILLLPLKFVFLFLSRIFIPPVCEIDGCHKKKVKNLLLCRSCYRKFSSLKNKLYQKPLLGERIKLSYLYWDYFIPFFSHANPIQELIHNFKYQYFFSHADFIIRCSLKYFTELQMFFNFDVVIPVPLHHAKKRLRGYNQSSFIAQRIAKGFQIPYDYLVLKRLNYTKSQTLYNAKQRQKNIYNQFKVMKDVSQKNIILVDDVMTTGSTANECCGVLKKAGVHKILVISLSRAIQ